MEDHEKSQEQIINELSDQHAQCACHDVAQNKETQEAEQETRTRYEALFQDMWIRRFRYGWTITLVDCRPER